MSAETTSEAAPAKINLALHITGQRADGYHLLDSIVAFASHGDLLTFSPADRDGFGLAGRFGASLSAEAGGKDDNLVLKARDLLRAALAADGHVMEPVAIELEKNLPVASGIGGGSADAAATLRGLLRFWRASLPPETLSAIALKLGADVPMCLESRPLRARAIGERIDMLGSIPRFALVLANPLKSVSTPDIFRRLAKRDNPPIGTLPTSCDIAAWIAFLSGLRNDLEAPARAIVPEIASVSTALREAGSQLVRMSGSGATCFGIFSDREQAEKAALELESRHPDWYVQATETENGSAG
ncbi:MULTISPECIES: 4-(cytidine 5'-diphospho)-2-C-methyl-D-erythritol kinase [Alphaproteobacteria]|uniref:4-diphosphocytidyl-2-C-methyl-D-erythritol kinase n=2 Tax=Alphaproteobacteria TaxID=28211 RepID=A0A512HHZ0_9HYPH|nr:MULTISPECIES: 4-(cytidine 5'-diphospho)-2-C-methyl-D-erythritol kinase [Alphaproteobacteria]GEO85072.1 4-diphosphocytidyl-2-C-methyl-D-erythritol kinase [Ciceribacter naphthalenivorans]GLR24594.1 4-diphosphocytidyl-2-C-methyl-D-erythritol kinase [Ciceribacter naphthalenivorans]GLT07450.1 4-diphosphocytidyl-2-C-methyl-D-erythritol kinase [Sphingomonas psychrolutea]